MNDTGEGTALRLDELSAGYHGGTVLHEISLEVAAGEVHAIVGHNGAGKTTLMNAVAGLIPAMSGELVLNGASVTRLPTHRRARLGIGYVPQGRRVFSSVTVAEHLAIAAGRKRKQQWTRAAVLEMFPRLGERLRHNGSQLSGGEQQMLAIARALLTGPRLLLLDEPTEGLAPAIVAQIREVVASLSAEGMTILLAVPQPDWPIRIADKVSVLSSGRITESLSAEQLNKNPSTLLDALHIASIPTGDTT